MVITMGCYQSSLWDAISHHYGMIWSSLWDAISHLYGMIWSSLWDDNCYYYEIGNGISNPLNPRITYTVGGGWEE